MSVVFQSPSGVLGVCRFDPDICARTPERVVSVPFRGFRGLQAVLAVLQGEFAHQTFQSPSGVLGVCRTRQRARRCGGYRAVSVPFRGFRGLQAHDGLTVEQAEAWGFSPLPGF